MGQRDNTTEFYRLLWPHREAILRTAQVLCHNTADAEDLAQEAMLKAFRRLDSLKDHAGAKAWRPCTIAPFNTYSIILNAKRPSLSFRSIVNRDRAGLAPAWEGMLQGVDH